VNDTLNPPANGSSRVANQAVFDVGPRSNDTAEHRCILVP
jgi:hypothetical protein